MYTIKDVLWQKEVHRIVKYQTNNNYTCLGIIKPGTNDQGELMLFTVESFAETPTLLSSLLMLKRSDLLALASHYKMETISGMRKNEIQTALMEYLIDEEIVSEDKQECRSQSNECCGA